MKIPKFAKQLYRGLPAPLISIVDQQRNRHVARKIDRKVSKALAAAGITNLEVNDFNNLLHLLREGELRQLPKASQHFISVGCAGTWYFEWIEKCCGPIALHTGIEYYSPKPDDLPAGVQWIANTAGDMSSIANDVGDILFSGQNIEHLWPADVTAFLSESWRVLKPDGLLVIDSPNRMVTAKAVWSHPEHTIELTPDEARKLVEASGFEVTALRGIWLCTDSATAQVMPFGDLLAVDPFSLKERMDGAANRPNESFCWWLEARKTQRQPNLALANNLVAAAFNKAWPERVNRLLTQAGTTRQIDGEKWICTDGKEGALLCGPFTPLPAGDYSVTFTVRALSLPADAVGQFVLLKVVDIADRDFATYTFPSDAFAGSGQLSITLNFHICEMTFGIQFKAIVSKQSQIAICAEISLVAHTDLAYSAPQQN